MGGVASLAAQLALPPSQLEFGPSTAWAGRGVWTKSNIPSGTRFGPFLGKWVLEPENDEFAWEVRIIFCYFWVFTNITEYRRLIQIPLCDPVKNPADYRRPFVRAASE